IVARNEAQQLRVARYYERAEPRRLIRGDPLALVVFQPGVANLPIVLRHGTDGLWYVDEPKAWTYFQRFENAVDFYPKYQNLPWLSELRRLEYANAYRPVFRGRVEMPVPRPYPFSLTTAVAELEKQIAERPNDDRLYAKLGEIYLFEINWMSKSLEMFERAAKLAPDRPEYQWGLFDLYGNNSEADKMLETLRVLSRRFPTDADIQGWYRHYKASYDFKPGEFSR